MEFYKVGGCVRDHIMGINPKDVDWVVVGGTHDQMIDMGYKQVGADFPVYLKPDYGHEVALARTERKTGKGYNGFTVETDGVTLKDDLGRRDLTINAMAMDVNDNIIDPYNGKEDIKNKILRHVNADAFKEDPVRVLRVARFLARWPEFTVAKETIKLCKEIVASGEMNHLTPERVWKETEKALSEPVSSRFFVFLRIVGALEIVFPEIHALIGQTQPYEHHPEGDAFVHTMLVLDHAEDGWCQGSTHIMTKFCALAHDFGKGVTPKDMLPHHYGHENAGVDVINAFADRLKVPNHFRDCAVLVSRYHTHIHNLDKLKESTIVRMFDDLKVKKNPEIIDILPEVSFYDSIGRTSYYYNRPYPNVTTAKSIFMVLAEVKLSKYKTEKEISEMSVDQIKNFLYREKINVVKKVKKEMEEWFSLHRT